MRFRQSFLRLLEAAEALQFYYNQLPYYVTQPEDTEGTGMWKHFFGIFFLFLQHMNKS
jgi:hypothetical protein